MKPIERWLHAPKPRVSPALARRLAREFYGLEAEPVELLAERDCNFRLDRDGGPAGVLKVHTADADPANLGFQNRALEHLRVHAPRLPVPRLRRSLAGRHLERWSGPDGRSHCVRLLSWLPGQPAGSAASADATPHAAGRLLAQLQLALADCPVRGAPADLPWDSTRFERLAALLPSLTEPGLRELVEERLARYAAEWGPALRARDAQAVHHDLHPDNILLQPDAPGRISGVIDFGDMVVAPPVCDLAVAGAYQAGAGDDPLRGLAALVRGFHEVRSLNPEDAGLLAGLIECRMSATLLIQGYRASAHPDNRAYFDSIRPDAGRRLACLDALGRETVAARIRAALTGGRAGTGDQKP